MSEPVYDVAIIGLGPAGSTLARLLNPKFSVLALDRKRASGNEGFHKPCGGLLATDAQKALARFGMTLPLDILVDPQIFSVRTIDVAGGLIRHYQRFYLNLDRHKLDLWLRSMIPPRVDVRDDAVCTRVERNPQGYRILWRENGMLQTAVARTLVGADGASSIVRKAVYPDADIRSYLAIQQWFPDRHASPFYSCVFDPEETDCYAWGLSKDGQFIFGGAFPLQRSRERFERLKKKLIPYGFHLEQPLKTEACLVMRPDRFLQYCGRDGAFLLGEAAGFVSPSSLEGISHALNSAFLLGRVLNSGAQNPNTSYKKATRAMRLRLLAKNLKCPFLYTPFLRKLVMKSGLRAVSMVNGDQAGD